MTKSFIRIKQIVGRILRQPGAQHYDNELLNTATIIVNVPASSYDTVVSELRTELRLYAPDDEPDIPVIRVKTRKDPLPAIAIKPEWSSKLSLPNRTLRAPAMSRAESIIRTLAGEWRPDSLDAPGRGRRTVVSLEREQQERDEFMDVVRGARTQNGIFIRRYLQNRNRGCLNAIHPDSFRGPGYQQYSCLGSAVQTELRELGERVVQIYEVGVEYQDDPDPDTAIFVVGDYRPRGKEMMPFKHSAHPEYSFSDMNLDEQEFARALDHLAIGVWARNPSTSTNGFSIPLPTKVQDSARFYPDFLWWVRDDLCYALDTTGRHLLDAKVHGKLIALDQPHVALVVRGHVDVNTGVASSKVGWTLVRARPNVKATAEIYDDLRPLLETLAETSIRS